MSSSESYQLGEKRMILKELNDIKTHLGLNGQNPTLSGAKSRIRKRILHLKSEFIHEANATRKLVSISQGKSLKKARR